MTWDLREQVIISLIGDAGHDVVPDRQDGWVECSLCSDSWGVAERALQAFDPDYETNMRIDNPLEINPCPRK